MNCPAGNPASGHNPASSSACRITVNVNPRRIRCPQRRSGSEPHADPNGEMTSSGASSSTGWFGIAVREERRMVASSKRAARCWRAGLGLSQDDFERAATDQGMWNAPVL